MDIPTLATATGYKWAQTASTKEDILQKFKELSAVKGPALLEIRIRGGESACVVVYAATDMSLVCACLALHTCVVLWPNRSPERPWSAQDEPQGKQDRLHELPAGLITRPGSTSILYISVVNSGQYISVVNS